MHFDFIEFLEKKNQWSVQTFGEGQRTVGILSHIRHELIEIEKDPADILEWIDVIFLALDGAFREGHTAEEIVKAMLKKHEINTNRSWPAPPNPDQPSFHNKTID
jgi:hypothetical protein